MKPGSAALTKIEDLMHRTNLCYNMLLEHRRSVIDAEHRALNRYSQREYADEINPELPSSVVEGILVSLDSYTYGKRNWMPRDQKMFPIHWDDCDASLGDGRLLLSLGQEDYLLLETDIDDDVLLQSCTLSQDWRTGKYRVTVRIKEKPKEILPDL